MAGSSPAMTSISGEKQLGMTDSSNDTDTGEKRSWWGRLAGGLKRTSSALGTALADIVTKGPMDPATLDEVEEALIRSDLGLEAAAEVREIISRGWYKQSMTEAEVRGVIADHVGKVLEPVAMPLQIGGARPFVILVVGVNGSGKTTLIGKLASKFTAEGKKTLLVAGDTFRAAAIDQLKIWGTRTGAQVIASTPGADAAGLAFDAVAHAKRDGADVVVIDTAGRLQNRTELMDELEKIVRVLKKIDADAPHAVLLVLDATVGQNAISQVELFRKTAGVTGLVMTKLDGTARGGILVALARKFALPIHFIGVGEGVDDLQPFSAKEFGKAVAGVDA
jgi:fused signal recognition particle receptor